MGFWNGSGPYANNLHLSPETDDHNNTSSLHLYRPDALPDAQPTVSKHERQKDQTYTNRVTQMLE